MASPPRSAKILAAPEPLRFAIRCLTFYVLGWEQSKMAFNPLQERGIPLEKQLRNWTELNTPP